MHGLLVWFLHFTGADNVSGPQYGFWSGFGSDLSEIALLGTVVTLYQRHKCKLCWRLSHHPVRGTTYKTCHKHLTANSHEKLYRKHAKDRPEQHRYLRVRDGEDGL